MRRIFSIFLFTFSFVLVTTAQQEVRFIVFGDSQFGNPPEFERMVYEASLLKPHFVIQVGDLINGYTHDKNKLRSEWKRYMGQISLLNSLFYPVPGNHDVVTDESEEVYAEVWGEDKLYYSFDHGPAHLIVLNSWWGDEDDRIMDWQREWLSKDLAMYAARFSESELSKKSIFIFLHSPLWKYAGHTEGRQDWDKVHELLKQYPVRLVVGGHTHEHVWQNSDGIDYLVINSAGVSRDNVRGGKFSAFLHVVVNEEGLVDAAAIKAGSVFPLDTVDPTDRKEASKFNINSKTILVPDWDEGKPMDRLIEVEVENNLEEELLYRLDWFIPHRADLKIEPESKWITVPAKGSVNEIFRFTSASAPAVNLLPHLELSTSVIYRTGSLSRELEKKYRDGMVNIDGYEPSIKLDEKLKSEIVIDAKINEDAWNSAVPIIFGRNDTPGTVETKVQLLYSEDYLYIAAIMEEPAPELIHTSAGGDIPLTWNDDDIEFFFDTEQSQKDYIRLFQNAAGTRFNSLQRWVENKYFKSKYKSEIEIGENYWSIEMKIPWSDIAIDRGPQPGDKWGFNIGRNRPNGMVKRMVWAGGLYNPRKYGILIYN
jgi:predicted phosphodiesterase